MNQMPTPAEQDSSQLRLERSWSSRSARLLGVAALVGASLTSVSAAEVPEAPDNCQVEHYYPETGRQTTVIYDDGRAIGKLAFRSLDNQSFHLEYLQYEANVEPSWDDMLFPSWGNKHRFVEAETAELNQRDSAFQRDDEQGNVIIDIDPTTKSFSSDCER